MQGSNSYIVLCADPQEHVFSVADRCELVRTDHDLVGINEIRSLITEAHRRPLEGYSTKSIALTGLKITTEAQQAALKILEEPPDGVSLVFVLPTGTHLLKTVLSRVQLQTVQEQVVTTEFSDWLKLSYSDRISLIEEKIKSKDNGWIQLIKVGLYQYSKNTNSQSLNELKELQLVVDNLLTRGASNKMLLEHLALSLPLIS